MRFHVRRSRSALKPFYSSLRELCSTCVWCVHTIPTMLMGCNPGETGPNRTFLSPYQLPRINLERWTTSMLSLFVDKWERLAFESNQGSTVQWAFLSIRCSNTHAVVTMHQVSVRGILRSQCTDVHADSLSFRGMDPVASARIRIIKGFKHMLPIDRTCRWQHGDNIASERTPCHFKNGSEPQNYEEVALCVKESHCHVTSRHLQLAVFRDPRPMAVSSYFFLKVS